MEAAMCLGLSLCLTSARIGGASPERLAALAIALCATIYLSVAAAWYQFGVLCCERHETFRECMVILLVVDLAGLAAGTKWVQWPRGSWLRGSWTTAAGPALLTISMLILFAGRIPALIEDYRGFAVTSDIRRQNWQEGNDRSRGTMTFLSAPPGCIGSGHTWQPGHYTLGGDTPWHIEAIMEFFRKDSLDVVQVPRSKPARCF